MREVETSVDHRVDARHEILEFVKDGTIGAELGVFTGLFSREILRLRKPSSLFLVDPWWLAFGDFYPDWGPYTANGRLGTRTAHAAVEARVAEAKGSCDVRIVVDRSISWLNSLPNDFLDWVYLDSTHEYDDTLRELLLIDKKLKKDGVILGDDWWIEPANQHYGVFRAIHDFIRMRQFDLIRADRHNQWALRRTLY